MTTKRAVTLSIVMLLGIAILVNVLAEQYYFRFDLTENNRYTLSQATLDILDNLEQPVTITAYFSKNLPPNLQQVKRRFRDLLVEYANRSDGKVSYEFVSPQDKKEEREAMQEGVRPVMVNVRKENQMKQQKVFLGAVIKYGNQSESIPFMKRGTAKEYALSSNIEKLTVENKPTVAVIQGHGEPSLDRLQQARSNLNVMYNVTTHNMNDTTAIPTNYKSVAIIAPSDSFPQRHLRQLDRYLANGGNLLIALNTVDANLQRRRGKVVNTGLGDWLSNKGVQVDQQFLIDAKAGNIQVTQQQGGFRFQSSIRLPYMPVISNFNNHPITKGLERVSLRFASPVTPTDTSGMTYEPLFMSSQNSDTRSAPTRIELQKQWSKGDFDKSSMTVGAALEGNMSGNANNRLVVFGDGDFAVGPENARGRRQRVNENNVNLLVNAIDWLSDDTGLIALRTKGISARPLDDISEGRMTFLKYLNFFLPIVIVMAIGLIRAQYRRAQRTKRKEVSYG